MGRKRSDDHKRYVSWEKFSTQAIRVCNILQLKVRRDKEVLGDETHHPDGVRVDILL